ncbi:RagB/SusD family nutrient uptake outer membrane protein [Flavobacterium sp.]|uniref:RagB/SusD family nutrient uptake outer membrane protein n=1 Tax=Flavobacterium sp. TaxID=239 RepID=UPI002FD93FB7
MKNLKIYVLAIIAGISFSCNDAIEIIQDGEFNDAAAYRTVADMTLALRAVYNQMDYEESIAFSTVFTDEVGIGYANGGQNLDDYRHILQDNSAAPNNMWVTQYRLINYANRLIRGAQGVTVQPGQEAEFNQILAETRALRAFSHFFLMTHFSTNLKDNSALGVIKMDFVPTTTDLLPRATNGELYQFIEEDLAFAEANLGNPTNYKFVTQNFIKAFRARMAAYRGDYTTALTNAQALIDAVPLTAAGTTASSPYLTMFRDLAQGENIFTLDRPVGKRTINSIWFFNQPNYQGGPFLDMGRNLFNLINATPGDIRRTAFVGSTSVIAADPATTPDYRFDDVLIIGKYPGKAGAPLLNDVKVFRVSEMYFIKAEALANAGNLNGASNSVASVLKQVRDARIVTGQPATTLPVYANATEAWADILKERRIELCFEGHRYIDIKRLGALANQSIDRYFRDCDFNGACTLPVTDYRFTLPIPIIETRVNSVIRAQQNPNY